MAGRRCRCVHAVDRGGARPNPTRDRVPHCLPVPIAAPHGSTAHWLGVIDKRLWRKFRRNTCSTRCA